jgi:hypothetical protein|nr:MAG TPA: large terminase [Caudoviricetes sp.]
MRSNRVENPHLDPVFLRYGQQVYTYDYIEKLREENLELKKQNQPTYNLIPQKGFQEEVLLNEATIKIIGGKRGGGKTAIGLIQALPYISNPLARLYGFRKLEDDVKRGIWRSSENIFTGFGEAKPSLLTWEFPSGATMTMEHLQDPRKITDRFRGSEMAYILLEELAEHTQSNMNVMFDLLTSNRNTVGVESRFVATCNPVGKSNALRHFLDWYIDPDTDTVIPERSGKIRYFYRFDEKSLKGIAWGNSPEEVYRNPNVKPIIDKMSAESGFDKYSYITSLCFIEGSPKENEILKTSDPNYMKRIAARGGKSTENDILGVWRDVDESDSILSLNDMERFFSNTEQRTGLIRASADIALSGDFFVIFAIDGNHVCDMEARSKIDGKLVVPIIKDFLSRNNIPEERFTYDVNGLGLWIKGDFPKSIPFNNKMRASDSTRWNNIKSECADLFVHEILAGEWSIDDRILKKTFKDKKGFTFSVGERLIAERLAIKNRESSKYAFELIAKDEMKTIVGHSPDFIEALFMSMLVKGVKKTIIRKGFSNYWVG